MEQRERIKDAADWRSDCVVSAAFSNQSDTSSHFRDYFSHSFRISGYQRDDRVCYRISSEKGDQKTGIRCRKSEQQEKFQRKICDTAGNLADSYGGTTLNIKQNERKDGAHER